MAGAHRPDVTAIPLGRPSPGASSNQPERQGQRKSPRRPKAPRVAPIRFCSRRGLPCRRRCRPRGALLPHPFTLALTRSCGPAGAVCFLWRFPWGRPRRTLSGAVSVWSPDFPPPSRRRRPSGRLAGRAYGAGAGAVKRNRARRNLRRGSSFLKLCANYDMPTMGWLHCAGFLELCRGQKRGSAARGGESIDA